VRSRPIEAPSSLRPEVPPELDAITLRALARDPERRFRNAHDLSEELDRFLLGRDERPTSKTVGRWMETIFGAERAALKKAISQGGEIETTLERLFALNAVRPTSDTDSPGNVGHTGSTGGHAKAQPRALWSTNFGSNPSGEKRPSEPSLGSMSGGPASGRLSSGGRAALVTPASPARAARAAVDASVARPETAGRKSSAALPIALGVGLVLGGIAVVALVALRGERSFSDAPARAAVRATATLEIRSDPEGAHVLVDGTPSGLRTPAVLTGLSAGSSVQISLDKPGYEPITEQIKVADGQRRTVSLTLRRSVEDPEKRSRE
jgi:hypothetical protein